MHAYVHSKQEQTVFLPGNLSIAFNYKFRVEKKILCMYRSVTHWKLLLKIQKNLTWIFIKTELEPYNESKKKEDKKKSTVKETAALLTKLC